MKSHEFDHEAVPIFVEDPELTQLAGYADADRRFVFQPSPNKVRTEIVDRKTATALISFNAASNGEYRIATTLLSVLNEVNLRLSILEEQAGIKAGPAKGNV